jgi:DNA-binding PadR family transcriptional regulator
MFGFHHGHQRGCGPRGGGFRRGGMEFEWRFGGGPRGGWGGERGRRRMFDGGELRLILLAFLEEGPRHGYDLIRAIEERTGGAYAPSPGVVYPTLTMLDELGQIDELKEEGARKRFQISEAGRAHLAERREEADALLARLDEVGEHRARGDKAPIRRAMAGLGMALAGALTSDPERAHAIAAILDEATQRIERL